MKIEIKPIERKTWHGKQGKESFKRPVTIHAELGDDSQYAIALDNTEKRFQDPKTGEPNSLTELEYYGKILNTDLSTAGSPERPHPFYDNDKRAQVTLPNQTSFLDSNNPIQHVQIAIVKASKRVANSLQEYYDGYFPNATHYIHDETEEVNTKASKIEVKNQAVIECSKLSAERKAQLIMILAGKDITSNSDNHMTVYMSELIEEKPEEVLRYIQLDKVDVAVEAMVRKAMHRGILKKKQHYIYYFDNKIGDSIDSVVRFFKLDENSELKVRIQEQLKK